MCAMLIEAMRGRWIPGAGVTGMCACAEAGGPCAASSSAPLLQCLDDRMGRSLNPELTVQLGWLATGLGSTCLSIPSVRVTNMSYGAWIFVGSGEPNSGPHDCVASTLPTELSPHPGHQLL